MNEAGIPEKNKKDGFEIGNVSLHPGVHHQYYLSDHPAPRDVWRTDSGDLTERFNADVPLKQVEKPARTQSDSFDVLVIAHPVATWTTPST